MSLTHSPRPIISLIFLAALPVIHGQHAKQENVPLLYSLITSGTPTLHREAEQAYAGKFRVVGTAPKEELSPGGFKGFYEPPLADPRSMRDYTTPGSISYAFVVTPDGRTTDIKILHSTDERVSKYITHRITYERFIPARFKGTPVYSLRAMEWKFGGADTSSRQSSDGLGVYHSRDR